MLFPSLSKGNIARHQVGHALESRVVRCGQRACEVVGTRQDRNLQDTTIKNNGSLDRSSGGPDKVIRVTTSLDTVDGTGHVVGCASREYLEEVNLTTAIGVAPASARTVLLGAWD